MLDQYSLKYSHVAHDPKAKTWQRLFPLNCTTITTEKQVDEKEHRTDNRRYQ